MSDRGDWDDFDDAGWDPLAAPDPPSDVERRRQAFIARCEEFLARWEDEDPRVDTDWWADTGG